MTRRVGVVAVLVLTLGVVAAVLLLRDDDGSDDESLAAFSSRGRPIEMAVPERIGPPSSSKLTGQAMLITERRGLRFLRLPRVDGSSCFAVAERRSGLWQLVNYGCEVGLARFPDAKQPVMLASRLEVLPGTLLTAYHSFQGFAADGVKRVAIVDEQDRVVPVADVVDNVFHAAEPPDRAKAVVALGGAGEVIWRGGEVQLPDE